LPLRTSTVSPGSDPDEITVSPSDESINVGDLVTVTATGRSELHSATLLEIRQGGGVLQWLEIHTSCSQPLAVGDVFGGLELVAFDGQRAGDEVTYAYAVTNNGSALTNVTLVDIPLGDIAGPFDLAGGETRTFQTVARILETITNTGIFSGYLANGAVCRGSDTASVTVIEPCGECRGGVTELTLRYIGSAAALIQVYEGHDPRPDKLLFEGAVLPDETFSFSGIRSDGTMGKEIALFGRRGEHQDPHQLFAAHRPWPRQRRLRGGGGL
jgi:hypothetical protein